MNIQGRFNQIANGEGVWPDMKYGDEHPVLSYAVGTTMKQMRAWATYVDHRYGDHYDWEKADR